MAFHFDNVLKRINHFSTNNNNIIPFTVVAWVYPTDLSGNRMVLAKSDDPSEWQCSYGNNIIPPDVTAADPHIRCYRQYSGANALSISTDNIMTINAWNFLAYTFDGTNAPSIYWGDATTMVSEVSYASQTAPTGTARDDTNNMQMARMVTAPSRNLLGDLGFYAIWNSELTETQLRQVQFGARPVDAKNIKILALPGWGGTTTVWNWSPGNMLNRTPQTLPNPPQMSWPDAPHTAPFGWSLEDDLFLRTVLHASSGSLQMTPAATRAAQRAVAGSVQTSGSVAREPQRSVSGSVQASGAVARQAERAVSATLQISGAVSRQVGRAVSGSVQAAGSVAKLVARSLSGSVQMTGSVVAAVVGAVADKIRAVTTRVRFTATETVYVASTKALQTLAALARMKSPKVSETKTDTTEVRQQGTHTTET